MAYCLQRLPIRLDFHRAGSCFLDMLEDHLRALIDDPRDTRHNEDITI